MSEKQKNLNEKEKIEMEIEEIALESENGEKIDIKELKVKETVGEEEKKEEDQKKDDEPLEGPELYDLVGRAYMMDFHKDSSGQKILSINIILTILTLLGIIQSFVEKGVSALIDYPLWAAMILVVSTFFASVHYYRRTHMDGAVPDWVGSLKFIGTCCIFSSFVMDVLVILPTFASWKEAKDVFISIPEIYIFVIAPIVAFIGYFFEDSFMVRKKEILFSIIPTALYAIVITILNSLGIINGPGYYGAMQYQNSYMPILWCLAVIVMAVVITLFIKSINGAVTRRRLNKDFDGLDV